MRVLALNCGSSSLKLQCIELEPGDAGGLRLARGAVRGIGSADGRIELEIGDERVREAAEVASQGAAVQLALDRLGAAGILAGELDAVGHRVVHGGLRFREPAIVDAATLEALEGLDDLAPLHNRPALAAIRAAGAALGGRVPMVAVFDTAFHAWLPERAWRYAVPRELADRHGLRRFGFHGLAHRSLVEQYAALTGAPLAGTRLVTFQLGSGCSIAAVADGRSIDTSMGLTPLEGLVMATRSGDVDPALPAVLARREGLDAGEVELLLNERSGLAGMTGGRTNVEELADAGSRGDAGAALAVELYCYRARKYLGAYLAALGGADAVLFGGGVGENVPEARARICEGLAWLGLELDPKRNADAVGAVARIGADGASIQAYVLSIDEEILIARDAAQAVAERGS